MYNTPSVTQKRSNYPFIFHEKTAAVKLAVNTPRKNPIMLINEKFKRAQLDPISFLIQHSKNFQKIPFTTPENFSSHLIKKTEKIGYTTKITSNILVPIR